MDYEINEITENLNKSPLFEEELSTLLLRAGDKIDALQRQRMLFWFAKNGIGAGLRVASLMGWAAEPPFAAGMGQLAWAARGGDADSILLSAEAPGLDGCDEWGGNALHHWAEAKEAGISAGAHVLLGLGLDPMKRDRWGLLPMHWGRDEGVWAWGMAAAWAKGDAEAWRACDGHDAADMMKLLHSGAMFEWADKVGMSGRHRTLSRRAAASSVSLDADGRAAVEDGLRIRASAIGKISEEQNCIARSLGIELLARQFQFMD